MSIYDPNFGSTVECPTSRVEHYITKTHDEWKYTVELIVGPADARWRLVARGDVLKEVMKDIEEQRKLMSK